MHPDDAATYRDIRLAALRTEPDAFGSIHDIEAARPLAHHAGRLAGSLAFAAFRDRRPVGLVGCTQADGPKEQHKGFLWGFYVEPAQRGQGVGAALLGAVLAAARARLEQVTLTVVSDKAPAIALYRRFGFVSYGLEPRALKVDGGYRDEMLMILRF